jgi:flavin-dependent dehydrogenase
MSVQSQGHRYDVLIVGARCAGAATAMLLARRGLRVLAVDKAGYGSDTLSTHALMRGAVLQLARWDLLPALQAAGTPPVTTTSFHYGGETLRLPIKPGPGGSALYAPRRSRLDRMLVDAARAAGAEVWHHHTLVDLLKAADGRVTGAVLRDPDGRRVELNAGLVIGADGIGSRVAQHAGAPVRLTAAHASATLFAYWHGLPADGYHWHYVPGASAGAIPTDAGAHCVFVCIGAARFRDRIRRDPASAYHRLIAEAAPGLAARLRGARQVTGLSVFAGRRGFFRQPYGPGWALVGDAGYFRDPVTAHGITDALRDAELLADAAAAGHDAAFRGYAETRDALAQPLFRATDAIAAFDWDLERLQVLHGRLNAAMKHEVADLAGRAHGTARAA